MHHTAAVRAGAARWDHCAGAGAAVLRLEGYRCRDALQVELAAEQGRHGDAAELMHALAPSRGARPVADLQDLIEAESYEDAVVLGRYLQKARLRQQHTSALCRGILHAAMVHLRSVLRTVGPGGLLGELALRRCFIVQLSMGSAAQSAEAEIWTAHNKICIHLPQRIIVPSM